MPCARIVATASFDLTEWNLILTQYQRVFVAKVGPLTYPHVIANLERVFRSHTVSVSTHWPRATIVATAFFELTEQRCIPSQHQRILITEVGSLTCHCQPRMPIAFAPSFFLPCLNPNLRKTFMVSTGLVWSGLLRRKPRTSLMLLNWGCSKRPSPVRSALSGYNIPWGLALNTKV